MYEITSVNYILKKKVFRIKVNNILSGSKYVLTIKIKKGYYMDGAARIWIKSRISAYLSNNPHHLVGAQFKELPNENVDHIKIKWLVQRKGKLEKSSQRNSI